MLSRIKRPAMRGALTSGAFLVILLSGCSLLLKTAEPQQCSTPSDCARGGSGRTCNQGFCVASEVALDAGSDAPENADAGGADAVFDAGMSVDAGPVATPGDVVVLLPEGLKSSSGIAIDAWNNAAAGSALKALPTDGAPILSKRGAQNCASFFQPARLTMVDDGTLTPAGDFSVTTVLAPQREAGPNFDIHGRAPVGRIAILRETDQSLHWTGYALLSSWQNAGQGTAQADYYAARTLLNAPSTAIEVRSPTLHDASLQVVGLTVRSAQGVAKLQLWVNGLPTGTPVVLPAPQPPNVPLMLGGLGSTAIGRMGYEGSICAVIVHHGAETEAELGSRNRALKTQFSIP